MNHIPVDRSKEVTSVAKGTLQGGREQERGASEWSPGLWVGWGWGSAASRHHQHSCSSWRQYPHAASSAGHYTALSQNRPHGVCNGTVSGWGMGCSTITVLLLQATRGKADGLYLHPTVDTASLAPSQTTSLLPSQLGCSSWGCFSSLILTKMPSPITDGIPQGFRASILFGWV